VGRGSDELFFHGVGAVGRERSFAAVNCEAVHQLGTDAGLTWGCFTLQLCKKIGLEMWQGKRTRLAFSWEFGERGGRMVTDARAIQNLNRTRGKEGKWKGFPHCCL